MKRGQILDHDELEIVLDGVRWVVGILIERHQVVHVFIVEVKPGGFKAPEVAGSQLQVVEGGIPGDAEALLHEFRLLLAPASSLSRSDHHHLLAQVFRLQPHIDGVDKGAICAA